MHIDKVVIIFSRIRKKLKNILSSFLLIIYTVFAEHLLWETSKQKHSLLANY